jgi:ERCC4-related helicase
VLQEVNNEFTSAERIVMYRQGGAMYLTTRILVVDLLQGRVDLRSVILLVIS